LQEAADASSGAIGGKMSLREISTAVMLHRAAAVLLSEMVRSASNRRSAEKGVPVGTKTVTMYVSDLDQSEIPAGQAYQLSIRHPDGSTQQLDISEQNYRDLKLAGVGKTLKKRGRKPGSTTTADSTPRKRRRRQTSEPPVTAWPKVPGKLLSAYAEVAAVVLAGLGLLSHRTHSRSEPLPAVAAIA
jgi:hypothetical protein